MPLYFDNNEFNTYLKNIHFHHGCTATKNKEHVYISANNSVSQLTGFKTADELIGKTDFDLKCGAVNNAEKYQLLDRVLLTSKADADFLCFDHYLTDWKILHGSHIVICNKNNESLAVTATAQPIQLEALKRLGISFHSLLLKMINKKRSFMIQLSKTYPGVNLTRKQSQVLYHIINDFSIKETALLLKLSQSSVRVHLEKIKIQLNCSSTSQLIEQSFSLGLMDVFISM